MNRLFSLGLGGLALAGCIASSNATLVRAEHFEQGFTKLPTEPDMVIALEKMLGEEWQRYASCLYREDTDGSNTWLVDAFTKGLVTMEGDVLITVTPDPWEPFRYVWLKGFGNYTARRAEDGWPMLRGDFRIIDKAQLTSTVIDDHVLQVEVVQSITVYPPPTPSTCERPKAAPLPQKIIYQVHLTSECDLCSKKVLAIDYTRGHEVILLDQENPVVVGCIDFENPHGNNTHAVIDLWGRGALKNSPQKRPQLGTEFIPSIQPQCGCPAVVQGARNGGQKPGKSKKRHGG